jgi:hypothetical protein
MASAAHWCAAEHRLRITVLIKSKKRSLDKPRRRWKDITIILRGMGSEGVEIQLAQDSARWRAVVKTTMNSQFPQKVEYFLTS